MSRRKAAVAACLALLCCAACEVQDKGKFSFLLQNETGRRPFLKNLEKHEIVPLRFDEMKSDPQSLKSFRNLRPNVLYPNAEGDQIYFLGVYDRKLMTFALECWYIVTPFVEWQPKEDGKGRFDSITIRRSRLEPTDFYEPPELGVQVYQKTHRQEERSKWGPFFEPEPAPGTQALPPAAPPPAKQRFSPF
ncbi:MAG: hypothetical protein V1918_09270 [Planctomycetota bacterium]